MIMEGCSKSGRSVIGGNSNGSSMSVARLEFPKIRHYSQGSHLKSVGETTSKWHCIWTGKNFQILDKNSDTKISKLKTSSMFQNKINQMTPIHVTDFDLNNFTRPPTPNPQRCLRPHQKLVLNDFEIEIVKLIFVFWIILWIEKWKIQIVNPGPPTSISIPSRSVTDRPSATQHLRKLGVKGRKKKLIGLLSKNI